MTIAPLSANEIKYFASKNGFTGKDLDIAVAVALAESGGKPDQHNKSDQTKDDSYGLWQINMYEKLGPSRAEELNLSSYDQLYDANTNAKAAYTIWKNHGGWLNWTTYRKKKYLTFMKAATAAKPINKVGRTPEQEKEIVGAVDDSVKPGLGIDPLNGISSALNALGANLFKSLANIAGILIALVLLGLGVTILISQSKTGKAAIKTGIGVAKKAAVVAAV